MYVEYLIMENTSLNAVISSIDNTFKKVMKNEPIPPNRMNKTVFMKSISEFMGPINQIFGADESKKLMRTLSTIRTEEIGVERYLIKKCGRVIYETEGGNTNTTQQKPDGNRNSSGDKKLSFLESLKLKIGNFIHKLVSSETFKKFEQKVDKAHDYMSKRTQSEVDNFLDRFLNKLDEDNILRRHRSIVSTVVFVFGVGISLAIMNIGVKAAGNNLNNVKGLIDFIKIALSSLSKGIIPFVFIITGLIMFCYFIYHLIKKAIAFILKKVKDLINKLKEKAIEPSNKSSEQNVEQVEKKDGKETGEKKGIEQADDDEIYGHPI